MVTKFLMASLVLTQTLFAGVPQPVITSSYVSGGYVTVAGRLASKPTMPVGVSIRNGNTLYSTLTDANGLWAVVVLLSEFNVYATSWSLTNLNERSVEVEARTGLK